MTEDDRESPDPHLAAYAKGLEDAARAVAGKSRTGREWIPESAFARLRNEIAADIRALSPLTPGSRVVVVPAEGSPEWEHAMERGMDYSRRAVSRGCTSEQHLELRLTYALAAALRALTGEEKA